MYNSFGIAAYPVEFFRTKVSPTKICIQFKDVPLKLRTLGNNSNMLPKDPTTHQPIAKISTSEVEFEVLAVGCQMPVLHDLVKAIIQGYDEYSRNHLPTYREVYKRDLVDDLKILQRDLNRVINKLLSNTDN